MIRRRRITRIASRSPCSVKLACAYRRWLTSPMAPSRASMAETEDGVTCRWLASAVVVTATPRSASM